MNMNKKLFLVLLLSMVIFLPNAAFAADVGLEWSQNTESPLCPEVQAECIVGYKVYYRYESETLYTLLSGEDECLGIASVEFWYPVPLEEEEMDLYFVITAYNGYDESGYSNEVCAYVNSNGDVAGCILPTVFIDADPYDVPSGGSTTLTWDSTDADSCYISRDPGTDIGSVATYGSVSVSQADDTTYTITAENGRGTATDWVTITVHLPPDPPSNLTVSISAVPMTIERGESSTLTWTLTGADSATIDNGIGTVAGETGSKTVSPTETMTYTITSTGPDGTATASVTVNVTDDQNGSGDDSSGCFINTIRR